MTIPIDAFDISALLEALIEKSLVNHDATSGRFSISETVREYARGHLAETGEAGAVLDRHLGCFVDAAREAEPYLQGSDQRPWMERLEADQVNLRAALAWSAESDETGDSGLSLCAILWRYWLWAGLFSEGRERCAVALAHPAASRHSPVRAETLRGAGILAWRQGDFEQAAVLLEEALAIRQKLGDRMGEAQVLQAFGIVVFNQGQYAASRSYTEQALALYRQTGNRIGEADALSNLGCIADEEGALPVAALLHGKSLAISRELGNRPQEAVTLTNLALVARRQGDFEAAASHIRRALSLQAELRIRRGVAECLTEMGYLARETGRAERAVHLLAASDSLRASMGAPLKAYDREQFDAAITDLRAAMGDEAFDAAFREGAALSLDQAVALALSVPAP